MRERIRSIISTPKRIQKCWKIEQEAMPFLRYFGDMYEHGSDLVEGILTPAGYDINPSLIPLLTAGSATIMEKVVKGKGLSTAEMQTIEHANQQALNGYYAVNLSQARLNVSISLDNNGAQDWISKFDQSMVAFLNFKSGQHSRHIQADNITAQEKIISFSFPWGEIPPDMMHLYVSTIRSSIGRYRLRIHWPLIPNSYLGANYASVIRN